jgi:hypothetical protein
LLWCVCAVLATGISSNPTVASSHTYWSTFFDTHALNTPGQSLPVLLQFMSVPPPSELNCLQTKDNATVPVSFPLLNRLAALLAIDQPVRNCARDRGASQSCVAIIPLQDAAYISTTPTALASSLLPNAFKDASACTCCA